MSDRPEPDEERTPAEAARERRRDRDASAAGRAGMRTGLSKQFRQVLDSQAERVRRTAAGPRSPGTDERSGPGAP